MKKQMRECISQREIRERLQRTAGILNESKSGVETDIINFGDITYGDLTDMIQDIVRDFLIRNEVESGEDERDEFDIELDEILTELGYELEK
jgi:hypothetical protein